MVEVTPYVSPCRKQEKSSEKKLHLRISKPRTDTAQNVAEALSHCSTVSTPDIVGVLTGLREYIIMALAQGRSIHLDGLGRIRLIPQFTKPVYEGDKFRNEDISTKTVQFLPDRDFIKAVRFKTHYHAGDLHQVRDVTVGDVKKFCEEWFAEHDVLITTELMHGLQLKRGRARLLLNALVEQKVLSKKRYGSILQFSPYVEGAED